MNQDVLMVHFFFLSFFKNQSFILSLIEKITMGKRYESLVKFLFTPL